MSEPIRLCPWCSPGPRVLHADGTTGEVWDGVGERTDGICKADKARLMAEIDAAFADRRGAAA